MEVQEEDPRANVVEQDAPLFPSKSQASAHSVRRTPVDSKGLESLTLAAEIFGGSRLPKLIVTNKSNNLSIF